MKKPEKESPKKIFNVDKSGKTIDGFQNFAARLGVSPYAQGNLISQGFYNFNLLTRNRVQLEAAYRGSWIVGRVIDARANDMTRAKIEINTNDGAEEVQEFETLMSRLQIWQRLRAGICWGRLYGGAISVVQIQGQDPKTPLDIDTIGEGQFIGLATYDRWQINPDLTQIIDSGPEIGLPKFYNIILGANPADPGQVPGSASQSNNPQGQVVVHHSRCIRHIGIELPFWQAITEQMWGESILERMWDRLLEFDTATSSAGNLISRAQLRTVGVESLREIMAAGGPAQEALLKQFEYMRQLQNNEGITLIDKEDTFSSTAYSFAGISDVLIQFGQQVSGSAETPLSVLFGQAPVGLGATGESDIRNYYDSINAAQEATMRPGMEMIIKVLWRSMMGESVPDDLTFTFTPLWQMSAIDQANIAKLNTDAVVEAHAAGLVTTATGMKELKQASGDTGLFSNITDEDINDAENEEPPMPDPTQTQLPGATAGELGGDPTEIKLPKPEAKDSAWKKIRNWLKAE